MSSPRAPINPSPTSRGVFDPWDSSTWGQLTEEDLVLGEDGNAWEVTWVSHEKTTVSHAGRTFTFSPTHDQPVKRQQGQLSKALDILINEFGEVEML